MKISDIAQATGGMNIGDCVRVIAAQSDFEKQIADLNRACPKGSFVKLGDALVYYNANDSRIFLRFGNKKSFGGPVLNWSVVRIGTSKPAATGTIGPSVDTGLSELKGYIKEPEGKHYKTMGGPPRYVDIDDEVTAAADLGRDPLAQGLVLLNRCLVDAEHELKKAVHPIDGDDSLTHKQADEVAEDLSAGVKRLVNAHLSPDKRNQKVENVYGVIREIVRNFIGLANTATVTPEIRKRLKSYYVPRAKQFAAMAKADDVKIADIADFVDCIHALAVGIAMYYEN